MHSPAGYEGWFILTVVAARGSHRGWVTFIPQTNHGRVRLSETTSSRSWSGFDPHPAATALLKQYKFTKHAQNVFLCFLT